VSANFGIRKPPPKIEAIRAALIEGEEGGFSDLTVDEIWKEARRRHREKDG
jgi:hypothetical protein